MVDGVSRIPIEKLLHGFTPGVPLPFGPDLQPGSPNFIIELMRFLEFHANLEHRFKKAVGESMIFPGTRSATHRQEGLRSSEIVF